MDVKDTKIRRLDIDEETYHNLLAMLNSSAEDRLVAFECIKRLDPVRNFMAIAFLRKNYKASLNHWENNCKTIQAHQELHGLRLDLSFKNLSDSLRRLKEYSEENEQFFTARYVEYLKKNLEGMPFVESVEINVIIKEYGKI